MKHIFLLIAAIISLSQVCRADSSNLPPDLEALVKEWEPPESIGGVDTNQGDRTLICRYTGRGRKPKSYKEIWAHYSAKLGNKESYAPRFGYAAYRVSIVTTETDATFSTTMVHQDDKATIIIHLASSRDDKDTIVTIVIELHDNASKPNPK